MKAIYEFYWDCHRMGYLEGVFIADKEEVTKVMGKHIYFGEVLGKHSEISGVLEEDDLKIKSEDQDFIAKCIEVFGNGTISGYNPLDYYDPDQDRPEGEILESEIDGLDEEDDGC